MDYVSKRVLRFYEKKIRAAVQDLLDREGVMEYFVRFGRGHRSYVQDGREVTVKDSNDNVLARYRVVVSAQLFRL